jgi:hypothetical protein
MTIQVPYIDDIIITWLTESWSSSEVWQFLVTSFVSFQLDIISCWMSAQGIYKFSESYFLDYFRHHHHIASLLIRAWTVSCFPFRLVLQSPLSFVYPVGQWYGLFKFWTECDTGVAQLTKGHDRFIKITAILYGTVWVPSHHGRQSKLRYTS